MMVPTQNTMQAAAIDRFGGPEVITLHALPLPEVGDDEILIRIASAGVGAWDPVEREGEFAKMLGQPAKFPLVLGSDGAGTVAKAGGQVKGLKEGDQVYAYGFLNPKGGFYAQYAAVKAANASKVPASLPLDQAGGLPVDAITALRGLDDVLRLKEGQTVLIFGASGGVGHLAVQLAKRLGARVLAAASGADGVELVKRLGADGVVDGRKEDVLAAARRFAPAGVDAALLTAGGAAAEKAAGAVRVGGRVAYPNGVQPAPKAPPGVEVQSYNGDPSPEGFARLNALIEKGPFEVHVTRAFPLERAAEAHEALKRHFVGKMVVRPA